jgi:ATP-dependent Clp protease adaptor protein ClpS
MDMEREAIHIYDMYRSARCSRRPAGCSTASRGLQQVRTTDEAMPLTADPSSDLRVRMADDDRKRKGDQSGPGTAVITKTRPQTKRPNLYRVLLLNDDYTPMEFVVHVLERFFNKDHDAAHRIMMHVHQHGIGECGIFTYEVAETKVTQVMDFARKHQHPLQCIMEKK